MRLGTVSIEFRKQLLPCKEKRGHDQRHKSVSLGWAHQTFSYYTRCYWLCRGWKIPREHSNLKVLKKWKKQHWFNLLPNLISKKGYISKIYLKKINTSRVSSSPSEDSGIEANECIQVSVRRRKLNRFQIIWYRKSQGNDSNVIDLNILLFKNQFDYI